MKILELIKILQQIHQENGDLHVMIRDNDTSWFMPLKMAEFEPHAEYDNDKPIIPACILKSFDYGEEPEWPLSEK